MQLELGWREVADPSVPAWDALDPNARRVCVHVLARAIAQAIGRVGNADEEDHPDD